MQTFIGNVNVFHMAIGFGIHICYTFAAGFPDSPMSILAVESCR